MEENRRGGGEIAIIYKTHKNHKIKMSVNWLDLMYP